MGTIDFFYGPGCSVDLVCRLPTMCINTDVPCLANGSLQKEEGEGGKEGRKEAGSLFVSRGHLRRRYLPGFRVDGNLCLPAGNDNCVST